MIDLWIIAGIIYRQELPFTVLELDGFNSKIVPRIDEEHIASGMWPLLYSCLEVRVCLGDGYYIIVIWGSKCLEDDQTFCLTLPNSAFPVEVFLYSV